MSSGAEHAKASVACAIALVPLIGPVWGPVAAFSAAAGSLAGIALSPDLDQEGLNKFENKLVKYTLGLGFLWVMVWYPYSRFIPHRGWLSHAPFVGTALRIVYLASVVGLGLVAAGIWRDHLPPLSAEVLPQIAWAIAGLAVSDIAHWVMDGYPLPEFLSHKRRRKKGRGSRRH